MKSGVLCKSLYADGCDTVFPAMLTACPDCGAGQVQNRSMPHEDSIGRRLYKSDGSPALKLRKPDDDLIIP